MKKHICIFVMIGVLCCVLPGCKQEDPLYRVYKENGEWYMEIPREIERPDNYVHVDGLRDLSSLYDFPIRFRSVLEMKRTVESGALPVEYLYELQQKRPETVFQIVDLDALYEPVFPEDIKEPDFVIMNLSVCEFEMTGKEDNLRGEFEIRYGPSRSVISEGEIVKYDLVLNENTAERKARDIIFEECGINATSKSPELCYRLISGEDTYTVREIGWHKIMILAEWEGVSIFVSLRGLKELPTLDWIAQFGIKPLEGAY